ncbi:MAG: hypothetical protein H6Q14_2680 [Bacteroidetes bacterium]|nr:hypothetical protein [Bacteroidota bacterium]
MKKSFTLNVFVSLFLLLVANSVYATDYNVSSGSVINISTPGSHTITGSGSSSIYIVGSASGSVFNITLNSMTLEAEDWASAINVENTSTGTMTVYFNVVGTNTTTGYNHGGIQSVGGTVNVIFTTASSGVLTSSAMYTGSYAFKNNGGTLVPSIDSNASCTATLAGTSTAVSDALSGAFTKSPLVLTLTYTTSGLENVNSAASIYVHSVGSITQIEGLQEGDSYQIYNTIGASIVNAKAASTSESISLPKGIYILKTGKSQIKFVH